MSVEFFGLVSGDVLVVKALLTISRWSNAQVVEVLQVDVAEELGVRALSRFGGVCSG